MPADQSYRNHVVRQATMEFGEAARPSVVSCDETTGEITIRLTAPYLPGPMLTVASRGLGCVQFTDPVLEVAS